MEKTTKSIIQKLCKENGITISELSERSRVAEKDVTEFIDGQNIPLAELRDIAWTLGTSVGVLLGQNRVSDIWIPTEMDSSTLEKIRPNWGYVGLFIENTREYKWYPATKESIKTVTKDNRQWALVPCFDNNLLIINRNHIKEIQFVDSDGPDAEIIPLETYQLTTVPPVFFESLFDFYDYIKLKKRLEDVNLSPMLAIRMQCIINTSKIKIDDIYDAANRMFLSYSDGTEYSFLMSIETNDTLGEFILKICNEEECADQWLKTIDSGESEIISNLEKVAMITMPLDKAELFIASFQTNRQ